MRSLRAWLRGWLLGGDYPTVEEYNTMRARVEDIARHFVIERDEMGAPKLTLADRHADEDGRPRPTPLPTKGSWNLRRRFLENSHAATPRARKAIQ